jgi:hypothetical protein
MICKLRHLISRKILCKNIISIVKTHSYQSHVIVPLTVGKLFVFYVVIKDDILEHHTFKVSFVSNVMIKKEPEFVNF